MEIEAALCAIQHRKDFYFLAWPWKIKQTETNGDGWRPTTSNFWLIKLPNRMR